jgi:hypothetical protein
MGYQFDDRGSILGKNNRFFVFSERPDRFWGTSSFLSSEYLGIFPRG